MIPLFGIGKVPAIVALFIYSLLPILRNTYIGMEDVDPVLMDAAKGMGHDRHAIHSPSRSAASHASHYGRNSLVCYLCHRMGNPWHRISVLADLGT